MDGVIVAVHFHNRVLVSICYVQVVFQNRDAKDILNLKQIIKTRAKKHKADDSINSVKHFNPLFHNNVRGG